MTTFETGDLSMSRMRRPVVKVFLAFLFTLIVGGSVVGGARVMAQTGMTAMTAVAVYAVARRTGSPRLRSRTPITRSAIAAAQSAGDNAWMLVSAALVLMMSGPGLALFYGGLVRQKNILGTMMQTFAMMGVITVLWALVTYSLAFGEGNAFIGGLHNVFLHGVGLKPDVKYAATIPLQTFMVYQLMFAIITPALITGAFAERMKFSAMLVFMILWAVFVYSPMAHMVWGKGGLSECFAGRTVSLTLDFAGGTVVHVTSGVSALVTALYLGKRLGYPKVPMPPHSVVLSFIGACLLVGGLVWIQCRARRCRAGTLATSAFVATHFGAAAAALSMERGRVDSPGQAFGAGSDLGRGGRVGGDYAGGWVRDADVGVC